MPTLNVLGGKVRLFEGGPIWPKLHPLWVRHCRKLIPIVCDTVPRIIKEAPLTQQFGVWCGPAFRHFGHSIADFGMRIATSIHENPEKLLVFSIPENRDPENFIPKFFWEIIELYGGKRENVRFISKPTLFKELIVYPQAERLEGPGPSERHLKLLSSLGGGGITKEAGNVVYFSRGRYLKGGIAGERYIEKLMTDMGVSVIHPEEHSIREQLRFVMDARTLIITEGSSVHLLQLLGRQVGDVIILCRRKSGLNFCKSACKARAKSVRYVEAVKGVICELDNLGNPRVSKGISILKPDLFISKLGTLGINLEPFWDAKLYDISRNHDIMQWVQEKLAKKKILFNPKKSKQKNSVSLENILKAL